MSGEYQNEQNVYRGRQTGKAVRHEALHKVANVGGDSSAPGEEGRTSWGQSGQAPRREQGRLSVRAPGKKGLKAEELGRVAASEMQMDVSMAAWSPGESMTRNDDGKPFSGLWGDAKSRAGFSGPEC